MVACWNAATGRRASASAARRARRTSGTRPASDGEVGPLHHLPRAGAQHRRRQRLLQRRGQRLVGRSQRRVANCAASAGRAASRSGARAGAPSSATDGSTPATYSVTNACARAPAWNWASKHDWNAARTRRRRRPAAPSARAPDRQRHAVGEHQRDEQPQEGTSSTTVTRCRTGTRGSSRSRSSAPPARRRTPLEVRGGQADQVREHAAPRTASTRLPCARPAPAGSSRARSRTRSGEQRRRDTASVDGVRCTITLSMIVWLESGIAAR